MGPTHNVCLIWWIFYRLCTQLLNRFFRFFFFFFFPFLHFCFSALLSICGDFFWHFRAVVITCKHSNVTFIIDFYLWLFFWGFVGRAWWGVVRKPTREGPKRHRQPLWIRVVDPFCSVSNVVSSKSVYTHLRSPPPSFTARALLEILWFCRWNDVHMCYDIMHTKEWRHLCMLIPNGKSNVGFMTQPHTRVCVERPKIFKRFPKIVRISCHPGLAHKTCAKQMRYVVRLCRLAVISVYPNRI